MTRTVAIVFIPLHNNFITTHYNIYNHKPIISNDYIQQSEPQETPIRLSLLSTTRRRDLHQKPTVNKLASPFSPARRERRTNSLRPVDSHLSRGLLVSKNGSMMNPNNPWMISFEYMYTFTFISLLSKVNYPPHKNNILEPKHSFPLDDPFCPYKVFGVLEVFNEALSIFVYITFLLFYCYASSFLALCHVSAAAQHPI